jgi:hypothetical protein
VVGENACQAKVMLGPLVGRLVTVFPERHKARIVFSIAAIHQALGAYMNAEGLELLN